MRSTVPDSPRASVQQRVHYDDFTGCVRASQQHARQKEIPEVAQIDSFTLHQFMRRPFSSFNSMY